MSDWAPGDLALCIRWRCPELPFIRQGGVYTVRKVWTNIHTLAPAIVALDFADVEYPAIDRAINARCFVKIRPHTPDAEDRETIRLLTGKPAKVEA